LSDDWGEVKVKIFKEPEDKIKKAVDAEGVDLEYRIRRRIDEVDKVIRNWEFINRSYDVGSCRDPNTGKDTVYIAMDYVNGGAVEEVVDGGYKIRDDISSSDAFGIFDKLLSGLDVLHRKDLIWRDVKLRNLLVSLDKEIVRIDDLETIAGVEEVQTGHRLTEGSDRYAAPEVMQSITNASKQSDLYSAAVCLLYMLTGDTTSIGKINQIQDGEQYSMRLVELLNEQFLNQFSVLDEFLVKSFFIKSLAYDPNKRYGSVELLRKDFDELNNFLFSEEKTKRPRLEVLEGILYGPSSHGDVKIAEKEFFKPYILKILSKEVYDGMMGIEESITLGQERNEKVYQMFFGDEND